MLHAVVICQSLPGYECAAQGKGGPLTVFFVNCQITVSKLPGRYLVAFWRVLGLVQGGVGVFGLIAAVRARLRPNYPLLALTLLFGNSNMMIVTSRTSLGKRGKPSKKGAPPPPPKLEGTGKSAHLRAPSTRRPARTSMSQKKSSASASAKASRRSM